MRKQYKKPLITTLIVLSLLTIFLISQTRDDQETRIHNNNEKPVVIAYQTGVDPSKVAQANQSYEKDSKQAIEWKKFDTGSDVVNALASGDVDIGNIGSRDRKSVV